MRATGNRRKAPQAASAVSDIGVSAELRLPVVRRPAGCADGGAGQRKTRVACDLMCSADQAERVPRRIQVDTEATVLGRLMVVAPRAQIEDRGLGRIDVTDGEV